MMFSRSARVPKGTCHAPFLIIVKSIDDPNGEVVVAVNYRLVSC